MSMVPTAAVVNYINPSVLGGSEGLGEVIGGETIIGVCEISSQNVVLAVTS